MTQTDTRPAATELDNETVNQLRAERSSGVTIAELRKAYPSLSAATIRKAVGEPGQAKPKATTRSSPRRASRRLQTRPTTSAVQATDTRRSEGKARAPKKAAEVGEPPLDGDSREVRDEREAKPKTRRAKATVTTTKVEPVEPQRSSFGKGAEGTKAYREAHTGVRDGARSLPGGHSAEGAAEVQREDSRQAEGSRSSSRRHRAAVRLQVVG
jgi:hypothetical protein